MSFESAVDAWADSIEKALTTQRYVVRVQIDQRETDLNALQLALEDSEFVTRALRLFTKQFLFGTTEESFYSQFQQRAKQRSVYYPKMQESGFLRGSQTLSDNDFNGAIKDNKKRVSMSQGFAALWNIFAESRSGDIVSAPNQFTVRIGNLNRLNSLQLSDYMWVDGGRKGGSINSLFKAVEFGTGIASNVGGPQWVRHEGPTKESDGSWWLGEERGDGVRIEGQKGFHFLYDEHTRKPKRSYIDFFRREFPRFFISLLKQRLSGNE